MTDDAVTVLFEEALALPEGERAAFLSQACGEDEALRSKIVRLLRHAPDAPQFFERISSGIARPPSDEDRIGSRVGAYRLESCIGRGGMGVVYLAERADGQFEQRVAIKLVQAALTSARRRDLFLHERQILARLEHPNIARLLDGGVTDEGVPYFVMEYVDGLPLTDYVSQRQPTVEQRLHLFLQICSAVAHAHRNMVVHRDLKPGNVLVMDNGMPKLLDFGIAGPLDAAAAGQSSGSVRSPATPAYASPEQLRGDPVTAVSDVFSLGVVLHELLTGARDVAADAPRPKSDLAWICARATEDEPADRYQSVEALTDDIGRYTRREVIHARPHSQIYRITRFAQRHRLGIAGGTVVGALIALYIGGAVRQARENVRQRDRAELENDASHHVASMLTDAIIEANGPPGREPIPMRVALDQGVERLNRELAQDHEVHGVILRVMAETYERLGYRAGAIGIARRSIEVLSAVRGGENPGVAGSWHALGRILLVSGCPVEADSALHRAMVLQEAHLREGDPSIGRTRADLARSEAALAGRPPPREGSVPPRPSEALGARGRAGPPAGPGGPGLPPPRGAPPRPPVATLDGPVDCHAALP